MLVVAQLPLLHTLVLRNREPEVWALLVHMPALTSLSLPVPFYTLSVGSELLEHLERCDHLVHLRLEKINFNTDLVRFCQSNMMQKLESLEITDGNVPANSVDIIAAFSSLRSLHTLRIQSFERINSLMPHMVHAPALRTLLLQLSSASVPASVIPTAIAINCLLETAPLLQCTLDLTNSQLEATQAFDLEVLAARSAARLRVTHI